MELSSAMVKEVASDELCKKVEEFTVRGTSGLQILFVPASNLESITSSVLGYIQVGRHLPTDLVVALSNTEIMDETKVMTCSVSSLIQGELGGGHEATFCCCQEKPGRSSKRDQDDEGH